jgi:hypothetical protein
MSPPRSLLLAAALALACAAPPRAARRDTPLPPPARESRAGARTPGAGPAPGFAAPGQLPPAPGDAAVARALETASSQVGRREIAVDGVRFGDDCAALVRAALASAGRAAPADPASLHALAAARGLLRRAGPAPGDIVFLAQRPDGPAVHVGIVESVSPEGTALLLHHTERGVARLRANVGRPWTARAGSGRWMNDVLLVDGARIPAGRLVVGFASLL